jgi:hypothetical protein
MEHHQLQKELPMTNTLQIGKRLIPLEQIALIEPFEPSEQSAMKSTRPFQTRVVLIDRDSVLTEEALPAFAEKHGFRMLTGDNVATNPAIHFGVEAFEPTEGFTPNKPYKSRLLWRDLDGRPNSKLLVTMPDDVLAFAVRGEAAPARNEEAPKALRRNRRRTPAMAPR